MRRKLSIEFIQKSALAIGCAVLICAGLAVMTGCATISGKQARAEKTARENKSEKVVQTGKIAPELVGKWHKTPADRFDYAVYAENLGNFETYEITADGRVKSETLSAARNYDCIVESSTKSEGTITSASNSPELNIRLDAGTTRTTNNCSPEKNSTGSTNAVTANYRWKVSEDAAGRAELCLTQPDGKTACYLHEN
jgi:hypothetical protein